MLSNCLIFALWRVWKRGGWIGARKSDYGWWPHFVWHPDPPAYYEEFVPPRKTKHLLPPPLFRGIVRQVRTGDSAIGEPS